MNQHPPNNDNVPNTNNPKKPRIIPTEQHEKPNTSTSLPATLSARGAASRKLSYVANTIRSEKVMLCDIGTLFDRCYWYLRRQKRSVVSLDLLVDEIVRATATAVAGRTATRSETREHIRVLARLAPEWCMIEHVNNEVNKPCDVFRLITVLHGEKIAAIRKAVVQRAHDELQQI